MEIHAKTKVRMNKIQLFQGDRGLRKKKREHFFRILRVLKCKIPRILKVIESILELTFSPSANNAGKYLKPGV